MPYYKWIHNSAELIKSGDAAASEENKAAMTAFPHHQEGDIDNIIAHTSEPKAAPLRRLLERLFLVLVINEVVTNTIIPSALVLVLLSYCYVVF
jgi:hypothetical protein